MVLLNPAVRTYKPLLLYTGVCMRGVRGWMAGMRILYLPYMISRYKAGFDHDVALSSISAYTFIIGVVSYQ
jgi:hypothetical protein